CGGMDACSPTLYHSGRSADVAAVANALIKTDQISHFALVGFSMGGNIVLKCAGEWGREGPPQFRAVAAVCPAMDLAPSADALHERQNRLYELYFIWKLRRRLLAKARLFPKHFDPALAWHLQPARIRRQGNRLLLRIWWRCGLLRSCGSR